MYGGPTTSAPSTLDPSRINGTNMSSASSSSMQRLSIANLLGPGSEPDVVKFDQNHRQYYRFRGELVYPFPIDEVEQERLDIFHALIYRTALRDQFPTVSLTPAGRTANLRILDVGYGTGFWMADVAQRYPNAQVLGFDLDEVPGTGSANCSFFSPVDFNAHQWPVDDASIDLVHMAQLCGSVPDWQALYDRAYRCLRPGTGQIETIEVDWIPRSAQGNLPAEATDLFIWWNYMQQSSQLAGKPMEYREDTEQLFERSGFVDVCHKRIRIPLYNYDIHDQTMSDLAHSYQTAMGHVGSQSFTGLSMALFTIYLKMPPARVEEICARALAVVQRERLPLHIDLHIWSARRPRK